VDGDAATSQRHREGECTWASTTSRDRVVRRRPRGRMNPLRTADHRRAALRTCDDHVIGSLRARANTTLDR
jgi:hypothetical protein